MPIRLLTSGGGTTTLQPTTSASSVTLTVPSVNANVVTTGDTASVTQAMLGSGLAGTGPTFSAYALSTQTTTNNVATKIRFDTEEYDTANCFDATTNYRFTPNVAGYYLIMMSIRLNSNIPSYFDTWAYKNGSAYQRLNEWYVNTGGTYPIQFHDTFALYMNGSTDYLEMYFEGTNASGPQIGLTNFNYTNHLRGFLLRAA